VEEEERGKRDENGKGVGKGSIGLRGDGDGVVVVYRQETG